VRHVGTHTFKDKKNKSVSQLARSFSRASLS